MTKAHRRTTCADKLKVLSDPTRLSVLRKLMSGPKSVSQLNQVLAMEQSLLSHHLQILRQAGFVDTRRDGRSVLYSLAPKMTSEAGKAIDLGCCKVDFERT